MSLFGLRSSSILVLSALLFGGCTANLAPLTSALSGSTTTSTSSTSVPGGARAVKIIFTQSSTGSFDAPTSGGTPVTPGSGLQATRIFNADSSLLASSSTLSAWPPWFSSFELGISGSNNTASQNVGCAHFATAGEAAARNCRLQGTSACPVVVGTESQCGAAANQFRVSEVDCSLNTPVTSNGNGGASDGVYFRANFSRNTTYLANTENILVNLEYAATSVNPAPTSPTACFTGGTFSPELCSDFVWRAYIKHSASEVVQPYLLLIPPTFGSVLGITAGGTSNGGTLITTKQFIVPLAGDTDLTTLQVSRIQSNFPGDQNAAACEDGGKAYKLKYYCNKNNTDTGGTPLCAGVIFYSITFFRI